MAFLDHWCHFPQDDLYSLATWGPHPLLSRHLLSKGGERQILFAHLNGVQKPLQFLCSLPLHPGQALEKGSGHQRGLPQERERRLLSWAEMVQSKPDICQTVPLTVESTYLTIKYYFLNSLVNMQ